jgi:nitrate/TMAO reductase-like tetraheme cytochrome c subunit
MGVKKNSFKMGFILLMALSVLFPVINAYANDNCVECHADDKFLVKNKILFDYYNYWKGSVHEAEGITCTDCHSGDAAAKDKETAHAKNFSSLTGKDTQAYKKIPAVCGNCHKAILKNFEESKHYKALQKDKTSPNCVTCHKSMNTEIYEAHNISEGCKACHNAETKQSPEVSKKAEDVLNRINFIRAYRKWVSIYYADEEPKRVKEINEQYKDIALAWHQYNFTNINEKTDKLLIDLRSMFQKKIAEKKKKNKS